MQSGNEARISLRLGGRVSIRLTHAGFYDEKSRKQHENAWPIVLKHLDEVFSRN